MRPPSKTVAGCQFAGHPLSLDVLEKYADLAFAPEATIMRRILPIVMASTAMLVAGCGSNKPASYVGTSRTTAVLITWSAQQHGRATGTITDETLSGAAPSETVQRETVPVTVRFNGADVSFNGTRIYALGATTISGTLRDGRLNITAPDATGYLESAVLRPGTRAVYNSDLAQLRQRMSHANTTAKRSQAHQQDSAQITTDQQQVSTDISTLQGDVSAMSSDLTQMGQDVQQVSSDLTQLQADAANGAGPSCENVSTVEDDATTVDSDGSTVGDDSTTVTSDISTVQGDISQLTTDVDALLKAGGKATGDPSPQTAISQAQGAITATLTQANSYITTVNEYLQEAYTAANNLAGGSCADAGD
jgi:chromosome segregation ATPase